MILEVDRIYNNIAGGTIVHCQLQVAVLTSEFYSNLTHFCDNINILNLVIINRKITYKISTISSKRHTLVDRFWSVFAIDQFKWQDKKNPYLIYFR